MVALRFTCVRRFGPPVESGSDCCKGAAIQTSLISLLARATTVAMLLVALPLPAQEGEPPTAVGDLGAEETGPRIQPAATEVLRKACSFLAAKPAFRVHTEVTFDEVFRSGPHVHRSRGVSLLLHRPDRLYVESDSDRGRRNFYYDGSSVTIADIDARLYGRFDAPPTIESMLDDAMARFDVALPLADIASADPCAALEANAERGWYLGEHYFAGERSHHLFITSPDVDVQLWISTGPEPVFRKIVLTYTSERDKPQYGVVFSGWDFAPRYDEATFRYTPPADARRIEFVVRAPAAASADKGQAQAGGEQAR